MRRSITLTLFLLISSFLYAQYEPQPEIEREVNEQVWKVFKKSWENRDWKTFNEIHTDDVLRVSKWSGIRSGEAYKQANKDAFSVKRASTKTIDFWLEQRVYSENIGYEVGYYKVVVNRPDGDPRISYARFHVGLRKENGKWKISQDWDTSEINGVEITAEDYEKGTPLDLSY